MLDKIKGRIEELLDQGEKLLNLRDDQYYLPDDLVSFGMGWLAATANLVNIVTRGTGPYTQQMSRIMGHRDLNVGVVRDCVSQAFGILRSASDDWNSGLLRQIEYVVAAESFDDFLDHSEQYHKAGKKTEAAILVSAVSGDVVRILRIFFHRELDESKEIQRATRPQFGSTWSPIRFDSAGR